MDQVTVAAFFVIAAFFLVTAMIIDILSNFYLKSEINLKMHQIAPFSKFPGSYHAPCI